MEEEEVKSPRYHIDFTGLLDNGNPYFPKIGKGEEIEWVSLNARPCDSLKWQIEKQDKKIFWQLNLFEDEPIDLFDNALFSANVLAIEEFTKNILTKFKEQTFGVSLFSIEKSFTERVLWNFDLKEGCKEDPELYAASCFSEYIHRLISFLPDDVLVFGLVDLSAISSQTRQAQLISKERFEHISIGAKGALFPTYGLHWDGKKSAFFKEEPEIKEGLCLPSDSFLTEEISTLIDKEQRDWRIIPEFFLSEGWQGLDTIFVVEKTLTPLAKRKLAGFEAAGGEIKAILVEIKDE